MFKVGQKVKCIHAGEIPGTHKGHSNAVTPLKEGETYTIADEECGGMVSVRLPDRGGEYTCFALRFVPAGPTQAEKDAKELAALERDEQEDDAEKKRDPGFKLGDEIVCVHPGIFIVPEQGRTHIVTKVSDDMIGVDGDDIGVLPGRFRKAPEKHLTFADLKPGDWFLNGDSLWQKRVDDPAGATDPMDGMRGNFADNPRVVRVKVKITVEKS